MLLPPSYVEVATLYTGRRNLVARVRRREDGAPLVLKTLRSDYPGIEELSRFRREYEISRQLSIDGVVRVLGFETHDNRPYLIMLDRGGEALARRLGAGRLPLREAVRTARLVALALAGIHERGVVHRDINPSNIVVLAGGGIEVIDFGIASLLEREDAAAESPGSLEGTLAYLAPEQSGRTNRGVDARADLYALGATLYEMVTGAPPFAAQSALEMVHAHLARTPSPLEGVGSALAELVARLLAKTPEERYQSAAGVALDLESCLEAIDEGRQPRVRMGARDMSDQLRLPERLYGRDNEVQELLGAYERSAEGRAELVLVTGYAGAGKSRLVAEIHKPVASRRGRFLRGKYEERRSDAACSAVLSALGSGIEEMLAEPGADGELQRARWAETLGDDAAAAVAILPGLRAILGALPPPAPLSASEAQHRFMRVMRRLVVGLASPARPLALFLDDLQWADPSSMRLVTELMLDERAENLLLIGAYRDDEIDSAHPLSRALTSVREGGGALRELRVGPLGPAEVTALLADALHSSREHAAPLAEVLHARTAGNPFFLGQTVRLLVLRGAISLSGSERVWRWDLGEVRRVEHADSALSLMAIRLRDLSDGTREALGVAATIGGGFDLSTLSALVGASPVAASELLWPALVEGLVVPVDDAYRFVAFGGARIVRYRFVHDRVREAAYGLIEERERGALHLRIGRLLWSQGAEQPEHLLEVAHHLVRGAAGIDPGEERGAAAELLLRAARAAKASGLHALSFAHGEAALGLLGPSRRGALVLSLCAETAEAALLSGRLDAVDGLIDAGLSQARSLLEAAALHEVRIKALLIRHRMPEAAALALEVLAGLGESVPATPGPGYMLRELGRTKFALRGRSDEQLLALPAMAGEQEAAVLRIATAIAPGALHAHPNLLPALALRLVRICVRAGLSSDSPGAFAMYGVIQATLGDVASGERFTALSRRMAQRLRAHEGYTIFAAGYFIQHHTQPLAASLLPLAEAAAQSAADGDFELAGHALVVRALYRLLTGAPLAVTAADLAVAIEKMGRWGQETTRDRARVLAQIAHNLLGRAEDPRRLVGDWYDELAMGPRHEASHEPYCPCLARVFRAHIALLFNDPVQALAEITLAADVMYSAAGTALVPFADFLEALARIGCARGEHRVSRAASALRVEPALRRLRAAAGRVPEDHAHRVRLVEAERAALLGRRAEAFEAFDDAVAAARRSLNPADLALCAERAARFHADEGRAGLATGYLRQAFHAYGQWGAQAKLGELRRDHPHVLGVEGPESSPRPETGSIHTTSDLTGRSLDFSSAVKASQAISREIVVANLLRTLLFVAMENAGADRGLLLVRRGALLLVESEQADGVTAEHAGIDVAAFGAICQAAVSYVQRTGSHLLCRDARADGALQRDAHVRARGVRSLLVVPLLRGGAMVGMVYLENASMAGAFTEERLELLRLLAAQAAISLENGALYAELEANNQALEERVAERTGALERSLSRVVEAQDRLRADLSDAADFVRSLLPSPGPCGALVADWRFDPSASLGGDALGYAALDGQVSMFVLDVCGHGIASALLAASVVVALRNRGLPSVNFSDPSSVLGGLNEAFPAASNRGLFFTIWYGVFDSRSRTLRYASAGHPPSLLVRPGTPVTELGTPGTLIGVAPDVRFESAEHELRPGDRLYVFSDGAYEIVLPDGTLLPFERFVDEVAETASLDGLLAFIRARRGGGSLDDDVSVLEMSFP